jgi:hypothetical protein
MRLWVHLIWRQTNGGVLQTAGPKENGRLEELINRYGEQHVAYAWYLYVNSEPRAYHLEPVKHVDKFTSKNGKTYVNHVEDEGAVTRFPLSAFLALNEGYIVEATIRIQDKGGHMGDKEAVVRALKGVVPGLNSKWGLSAENV